MVAFAKKPVQLTPPALRGYQRNGGPTIKTKVWYLYHSGFAVETPGHILIFDYWRQQPKGKGLEYGVVDPAMLKDRNVLVFVSHKHGDHFNREIFKWKQDIPNLRFILSDDVPNQPGAFMVGPGAHMEQGDFTLETLASNDEGVAFVVDVDGLCIFHAGDLNWWHWEGEPDDYNQGMADSYKSQIDMLRGRKVDIAFVPVDPRLEKQYAWGINYFMDTVEAKNVIPMHFEKEGSIVGRLLLDGDSEGYREKIIRLVERGASAEIEIS